MGGPVFEVAGIVKAKAPHRIAARLTLSRRERGLTEVSGVIHRPERPRRLWIQSKTLRSVKIANIPGSVPSPLGEG
jgi:hypothetical protein